MRPEDLTREELVQRVAEQTRLIRFLKTESENLKVTAESFRARNRVLETRVKVMRKMVVVVEARNGVTKREVSRDFQIYGDIYD